MLLDLWTEALWVLITVGGPFVVVALIVGLLTSVFQTATQLQENIIAFVPKVVAIGAVLAFAGSWLLSQLVRHFESIALAIEQLGHH
jgi:flagellar biosynthetic protein FliQ